MSNATFMELHDSVARIEFLVSQIVEEDFGEDVVNMAQEELSELKAAMGNLLAHGVESLPRLALEGDPAWRTFQNRLRRARNLLEPLL